MFFDTNREQPSRIFPLSHRKTSYANPSHKNDRQPFQTMQLPISKSFRSGGSSHHKSGTTGPRKSTMIGPHRSTTIVYKNQIRVGGLSDEKEVNKLGQRSPRADKSSNYPPETAYSNFHSILKRYQQLKHSQNEYLKQIVTDELISQLKHKHEPFSKIHPLLAEMLLLTGRIQILPHGEEIQGIHSHIFVVLFGSVKLYNRDYQWIAEETETFGSETVLFGFEGSLQAKTRQQSCLLILPVENYQVMRESMIRSKFKHQFQMLESILRLNFIKKHMPTKTSKLRLK